MDNSIYYQRPVVPVDSTTFTHSDSSDQKFDYEQFWKNEHSFIQTCLTFATADCMSKIIIEKKIETWIVQVIKSFIKYGCVCVDESSQVYEMSDINIHFQSSSNMSVMYKFVNQRPIIGYTFKKEFFNPTKLWFYTVYPIFSYLNRDNDAFEYNCPSYNSRKSFYELIHREKMNIKRLQWNTSPRLLIHDDNTNLNNNTYEQGRSGGFHFGAVVDKKAKNGVHYDENRVQKTFLNTPSNGLPFPSLHDGQAMNEINDLKRMICVGIFNINATSCGVPGVSNSEKFNGMRNEPIKINDIYHITILHKILSICEDHNTVQFKIQESENRIPFSMEHFDVIRSIGTKEGIQDYLKSTLGLKKSDIDASNLERYISPDAIECIPKTKKMKIHKNSINVQK